MKCVEYLILYVMLTLAHAQLELPSYITPCKTEDNKCLKKVLKNLQPHLKGGIPEFQLQSIDPATLPDYQQSDISSLKMPYSANLTNIRCVGASTFEILEFKVDLSELKFNLEIIFPRLVITANEIILIKGLGTEVSGEWPIKKTYNNLIMIFLLNGTKYLNKGQQHLRWTEDHIDVSFDKEYYEVGDEFRNGTEYLNFLNKASKELPKIFKLAIQQFIRKTFGQFILRSLNTVHKIYPFDELYSFNK